MYIASKVLHLEDGSVLFVYAEGRETDLEQRDKMRWYWRLEDANERMRVVLGAGRDLHTLSADPHHAMDDLVAFLEADAEAYAYEMRTFHEGALEEQEFTTSRSCARWAQDHLQELQYLAATLDEQETPR